MGLDVYVYYQIDQNAMEEIIQTHSLDRTTWDLDKRRTIAEQYRSKYMPNLRTNRINYIWENDLHKLYDSRGVNFIRDDHRFTDRYYHESFKAKYGVPFPDCLDHILGFLGFIGYKKKAQDVADALLKYFSEDANLVCFAEWLRETEPYALYYELDY